MSVRNLILNAAAPGFNFGANWSNRRSLSAAGDNYGFGQINAVAYGGGKYVVCGRGSSKIATSSDLSTFTHNTFDTDLPVGGGNLTMDYCSYLGGRFVGTMRYTNFPIVTSTDGVSWLVADSDDSAVWSTRDFITSGTYLSNRVAHNGSTYVAVGGDSSYNTPKCMTSSNGYNWFEQAGFTSTLGSGCFPVAVFWTGVNFVAIAQESNVFGTLVSNAPLRIVTSTNGVTWTESTGHGLKNFASATLHNGDVVIMCTDSLLGFRAAKSVDDGLTWSLGTSVITNTPFSMVSTGTYLILIQGSSSISRATDYNTTWSTTNISSLSGSPFVQHPYNSQDIATKSVSYANGKLLVGGGSLAALYELDPATFAINDKYPNINDRATKFIQFNCESAAYDGSNYIFVGQYGRIAKISSADLPSSSIRAALTSVTLNALAGWGTVGSVNTAVWDGSQFVVAGDDGKVATSPDGTTWTYRAGLRSSAWGTTADAFCMIVVSGTIYVFGQDGKVASSSDGITWSPTTSLSSSTWGARDVNGVAHDGTNFLIVGEDGYVATTTDLSSWTVNTSLSGANDLNSVTWSSDLSLFAFCGQNGLLYTTPDGSTLTQRSLGITDNLSGIVWGSDRFILVGRGKAYSSTDGITWTNRTNALFNLTDWSSSVTPNSVHWLGSRFLACGPSGLLATSP